MSSFGKEGLSLWMGQHPDLQHCGRGTQSGNCQKIAIELQEKNLYIFMCAEFEGRRFSEQLVEAGVQIGWPTRLVSLDLTSPRPSLLWFCLSCRHGFGGINPEIFVKI